MLLNKFVGALFFITNMSYAASCPIQIQPGPGGALPEQPANTLTIYSSSLLRNFSGTQLTEHIIDIGRAALDTPICRDIHSEPCTIMMHKTLKMNLLTMKGSVAGDCNIIITNLLGVDYVTATYPIKADVDATGIVITHKGSLSGTITTPDKRDIPFKATIYMPYACGNNFCYADGSIIQPCEMIAGKPVVKSVYTFL